MNFKEFKGIVANTEIVKWKQLGTDGQVTEIPITALTAEHLVKNIKTVRKRIRNYSSVIENAKYQRKTNENILDAMLILAEERGIDPTSFTFEKSVEEIQADIEATAIKEKGKKLKS
jgi:hypothetical protein